MATPTPTATPGIDEDTRRFNVVKSKFDELGEGNFGLAQWEYLSQEAKDFLYNALAIAAEQRFASPTPTMTPTKDPDLPENWDKQINYIKTPVR